jgi:hypothetical protein
MNIFNNEPAQSETQRLYTPEQLPPLVQARLRAVDEAVMIVSKSRERVLVRERAARHIASLEHLNERATEHTSHLVTSEPAPKGAPTMSSMEREALVAAFERELSTTETVEDIQKRVWMASQGFIEPEADMQTDTQTPEAITNGNQLMEALLAVNQAFDN